ncbi:condensation domain-containing protein [Amycolatopsis arida]|nr:condensation domain-containing protein [Amycolatopsis arida]
MFDKGDEVGIFGPRYVHVDGWRIRGRVDIRTLQAALNDVVTRHESLRTAVVRDQQEGYQVVAPPSPPLLRVRELRDVVDHERRIQELLNEEEYREFSPQREVLLEATLVRFADDDNLLLLTAHHTATDAWSMPLIIRDLAACYAARKGHRPAALPEPSQYRDYVAHQLADSSRSLRVAREYWRDKLTGAEILALPTDQPRSAGDWAEASWLRFATEPERRAATVRTAARLRSSPFMILLAAYKVMLHRATGATDIVVPTFTPGRNEAIFQNSVGSFVNFLPLRTDVSGCRTFSDVVKQVRVTCMEAYQHEIPLAHILSEAPDLMNPAMRDDRAPCVFQVVQPPLLKDRELIGDLEYSAIWRRELSQPVGSYIPDGMLWCLHLGPTNDILANIAYSRGLFDDDRVERSAAEFISLLGELAADPEVRLDRIRTS